MAFKEIKLLPERRSNRYGEKANRFEKGLSNFVNRALKHTFESFKQEYDKGQDIKKACVIQLIDRTMSKKKKMYIRWKLLNERAILMQKCRRVGQVMAQINLVIKSVADNAFSLGKDNLLKERALIKLNELFRAGFAQAFRRWREVNRIEKLRSNISKGNRKFILQLL